MKKLIFTALACVMMLSGCRMLDEKNTSNAVRDYYKTAQQIRTGLNGLYDPVRNIYTAGMFQMTECATDVIYLSSYTRPDSNCAISPSNACHGKNVWKQGYIGVMRCNEMCDVINEALLKKTITEAEYKELYGEAIVLRAMYYYCLTNVFGDVPFYTCAVTEQNRADIAHLGRTAAGEIRDYLIDELKDCLMPKTLGGGEFLPLVKSFAPGTNYRAGATVGLMLAGKFCMWNERWEDAAKIYGVLEDIYGHYTESPETFGRDYPLTDIPFSRKFTPESIFEISNKIVEYGQQEFFTLASYCTPSRNTVAVDDDEEITDPGAATISDNYNGICIPEMGGAARTYKSARPTKYFYNELMTYNGADLRSGEYSAGAVTPRGGSGNLAWRWSGYTVDDTEHADRQVMWFNDCKSATARPWLGNKFWCPGMNYYRDSNNAKVFRFAGVLLNMAEVQLMLGNTSEACNYLNVTRTRAGLPKVSSSDQDLLLDEIQKECARELYGEFQRKFDLVRWGIWYERTVEYNNSGYIRDYIKPYHKFYPIPDDQVTYSGGALNNDDYLEN